MLNLRPSVLVLDEIDSLSTDQHAFKSLKDLINTHQDTLRVIGIANTHTLTSTGLFASEETTTIHFTPYAAPSLMSILAPRLSPLTSESPSFIPTPTLLLLTRRIANTTGDVRAMMSVLNRAIDLSFSEKSTSVKPAHILEAIKRDRAAQPSASDCMNNIRELELHARLVLCIVLLALHRTARGFQLMKDETSRTSARSASLNHSTLHSYYCLLLKGSPMRPFHGMNSRTFLQCWRSTGSFYSLFLCHMAGKNLRRQLLLQVRSGKKKSFEGFSSSKDPRQMR